MRYKSIVLLMQGLIRSDQFVKACNTKQLVTLKESKVPIQLASAVEMLANERPLTSLGKCI